MSAMLIFNTPCISASFYFLYGIEIYNCLLALITDIDMTDTDKLEQLASNLTDQKAENKDLINDPKILNDLFLLTIYLNLTKSYIVPDRKPLFFKITDDDETS